MKRDDGKIKAEQIIARVSNTEKKKLLSHLPSQKGVMAGQLLSGCWLMLRK